LNTGLWNHTGGFCSRYKIHFFGHFWFYNKYMYLDWGEWLLSCHERNFRLISYEWQGKNKSWILILFRFFLSGKSRTFYFFLVKKQQQILKILYIHFVSLNLDQDTMFMETERQLMWIQFHGVWDNQQIWLSSIIHCHF